VSVDEPGNRLAGAITVSEETKEATLTIRIRPSIKAKAVKRAKAEGRSLANYLERLIEQDSKPSGSRSLGGSAR
jgi:predicted HicB family RNase H-like nuclease